MGSRLENTRHRSESIFISTSWHPGCQTIVGWVQNPDVLALALVLAPGEYMGRGLVFIASCSVLHYSASSHP
jgi:hypothetical protein